MPHITIDYAPDLAADIDVAGLCDHMRQAAIATGIFPLAGVRVRAFAADFVSMADGRADHGYIDISVRLRVGRPHAARAAAASALYDAAADFVAPVMARRSLALSLEVREIDADLGLKGGTVRDHLPEHLR